MKQLRDFPSYAKQISMGCLISMLFVLIILLNGTPPLLYPVTLIIYSALIYLINRLFAKRERTVVQLAILNFLCAAIYVVLMAMAGSFGPVWQWGYGILSVILVTAFGIASVHGRSKLNTILLLLDGNIILMIFSILLLASLPHGYAWALFGIAGAIAALLGSISYRIGRNLGKREWGIILFLLIVIALIAWLLFSFVVSPLSTGVSGIGHGAMVAFQFIGKQLTRFFTWLTSLFADDSAAEAVDLGAMPSSAGLEPEYEGTADLGALPVIIVCVIIAAIIIGLILILRKTGKSRLKTKAAGTMEKTVSVQSTPFGKALAKIWGRWNRWINTRRWLSANKDTPEGIYFRLKKLCKHTSLAEQPGDTAAEFLLRIEAAVFWRNYPKSDESDENQTKTEVFGRNHPKSEQIQQLIRLLNYNLYSGRTKTETCPWGNELVAETQKWIRESKKK